MREKNSRFKPVLIILSMVIFISQPLLARAETPKNLMGEALLEIQILEENTKTFWRI